MRSKNQMLKIIIIYIQILKGEMIHKIRFFCYLSQKFIQMQQKIMVLQVEERSKIMQKEVKAVLMPRRREYIQIRIRIKVLQGIAPGG